MVGKNTLFDYEFEEIYDYFEYIVATVINGQNQQAKELIKKLSKEQKKEALQHMEENFQHFSVVEYEEAKQMILNAL